MKKFARGIINFPYGSSEADVRGAWLPLSNDLNAEFIKGNLVYKHHNWQINIDVYIVHQRMQAGGDQIYTRMRAPFVSKDGLRFKLDRNPLRRVIGKIFGRKDTIIGDSYFDKKYVVRGNNETKTKLLFQDVRLKVLTELQPSLRFLEIRDDEEYSSMSKPLPKGVDEIHCLCDGFITDKTLIKTLIDLSSFMLERLVEIDCATKEDPGAELDYWK